MPDIHLTILISARWSDSTIFFAYSKPVPER